MRILRRVAIGIGALIGALALIVGLALVDIYAASSVRLGQTFAVDARSVAIPSDAASIERGRHLVATVGQCGYCHGDNLGGQVLIDQPGFARLVAANITGGAGGAGRSFSDLDWVRALRHGVKPDGRGVVLMPAQNFRNLSDADLGAVIAYLKTVPPVDNQPPQTDLGLIARGLFLLDQFPALPAEQLDHGAAVPDAPREGVTPEYGRYLASISGCADCHGPHLSGATSTGAGSGGPPPPNLTPGGALSAWNEADFITAMRTGVAKGGRKLNGAMPFRYLGALTDDELRAIFSYLRSLPARRFGE